MTEEEKKELQELPLSELVAFSGHPFHVELDVRMEELKRSIQENGVLTPITVRKKLDKYEIISGHRRVFACNALEMTHISGMVKDLDEEEAITLMIESNLQRDTLLPSEKAFVFSMKYDQMKRQGKRNAQTYNPETRYTTAEYLSSLFGESEKQIRRYIRLTRLIPALLSRVDRKNQMFVVAVELTYLNHREQQFLEDYLLINPIRITSLQSEELRASSKIEPLNPQTISLILDQIPIKPRYFSTREDVYQFFNPDTPDEDISRKIMELLYEWKHHRNYPSVP